MDAGAGVPPLPMQSVPVPVEWGMPVRGCASAIWGRADPGTGGGLPVPVPVPAEDAGVGIGADAGAGVRECRCGAEVAGPAGAGDRVQEFLHGVPERAGAAARPQRVPALGDLPAGPVPDALPTHRGGLPRLLLPPSAPGQYVRMGSWHHPPLWGSPLFAHPRMAPCPGVWCQYPTDLHGCKSHCAPLSLASPQGTMLPLGFFHLGWLDGFGRIPQ